VERQTIAAYTWLTYWFYENFNMRNILQLHQLQRVSSLAAHCAFTDLIALDDGFLCCYRRAANHVSGDGSIDVVKLCKNGKRLFRQTLSFPQTDLRDPKLSIDDNGKIWLIAYCRQVKSDGSKVKTSMLSWFSDNGRYWSSPNRFGEHGWWLWRIAWHNNTALGLAYNRKANRLDLFQGHPQRRFYRHPVAALSLERDGLGYPNESDLVIDNNGVINALVRRDADSFSAQFGISKPPYHRWQWQDLGEYIGGPAMLPLGKEHFLVAGRKWNGDTFVTQIWLLNKSTTQLSECLTLPSAGDNSYPGLVLLGDDLFISYYSSHQDNQTRVYFAHVTGVETLANVIKQ